MNTPKVTPFAGMAQLPAEIVATTPAPMGVLTGFPLAVHRIPPYICEYQHIIYGREYHLRSGHQFADFWKILSWLKLPDFREKILAVF